MPVPINRGILEKRAELVLGMMIAGWGNADIANRLKRFGKQPVSIKGVEGFRRRHRDELIPLIEEARRQAIEAGIAERVERVRMLGQGWEELQELKTDAREGKVLPDVGHLIVAATVAQRQQIHEVSDLVGDLQRRTIPLVPVGGERGETSEVVAERETITERVIVRTYENVDVEDIG